MIIREILPTDGRNVIEAINDDGELVAIDPLELNKTEAQWAKALEPSDKIGRGTHHVAQLPNRDDNEAKRDAMMNGSGFSHYCASQRLGLDGSAEKEKEYYSTERLSDDEKKSLLFDHIPIVKRALDSKRQTKIITSKEINNIYSAITGVTGVVMRNWIDGAEEIAEKQFAEKVPALKGVLEKNTGLTFGKRRISEWEDIERAFEVQFEELKTSPDNAYRSFFKILVEVRVERIKAEAKAKLGKDAIEKTNEQIAEDKPTPEQDERLF